MSGRRVCAVRVCAAWVLLVGCAAAAFGQTAPGAARALVVPNAAATQAELAACLPPGLGQGGVDASLTFQGAPVGKWIAPVEDAFPMAVSAFGASVSPDGLRLVVEFAGCHPQNIPVPFMIFALIDPQGRLKYLGDPDTPYFDGIFGGSYASAYHVFGWLADSRTVLIDAAPYMRGFSAPTPWVSFGLDGHQEATFTTYNHALPAKGNRALFYTGPGGAESRAQNEIHEVQTETGKDTLLLTGSYWESIDIADVSETPDGAVEVRYQAGDGAAHTLIVQWTDQK